MVPGISAMQYIVPLLAALVAIVVFYVSTSYRSSRKYKLPPRVPGVPIFGNSFQVPAVQQGQWAKQLAEKYGEMYEPPEKLVDSETNDVSSGSLCNLVSAPGFF